MGTRGRIGRVLAAAAVTALVAGGGTGLAANRAGTDGPDALVGTDGPDRLNGRGGDDALRGLAGDDVYVFADAWGHDTLQEKPAYLVDGRRRPGGVDTLDFSAATAMVFARLVPEWGPEYNYALSYYTPEFGPGGRVDLGRSVVETIVGGSSQGMDYLSGGGQDNVLRPGAGKCDALGDAGGWPDGLLGRPGLRASDDTYAGLGRVTETLNVQDWGGAADVVDLRPLTTADVYAVAVNLDPDAAGNGTAESLMIVTGAVSEVVLYGQLGAFYPDYETAETYGYRGRIERLVFADRTVRGEDALRVLGGGAEEAGAAAAGGRLGPDAPARAARVRAAAAQLPTPAELAGR